MDRSLGQTAISNDSTGGGTLKYRPDIDGLRAIAVVSVLAFHVGIRRLSGGFVGVDIFFVISGYLITSILNEQIGKGVFSIVGFYERRIRRIFPALAVMLIVTSVLAYRNLLPSEIESYRLSLVAALLSVSNIYFWSQSGYFDLASITKPLLHTWSLGIEEQCYIVLPLILRITYHYFPRGVRPTVIGLTLVSLAFSAVGAFTDPTGTFYLLHTRIWELLLGGLISLDVFPVPHDRIWRNVLALIGLLLMGFAILFYTLWTPFPGLTALVPCAGAGLVILAGRGGPSLVSRVLSLRPIVFFGLISYSLYLWHWPLLVFQSTNAVLISSTPRNGKIAVVLVSIIAATLSWAFVERPFRRLAVSRSAILQSAAAVALVILGIAVALAALPSRFSPQAVSVANYLNDDRQHMQPEKCFVTSVADFERNKAACLTPSSSRPNLLIMGDSHAAHLWYGLDKVLTDEHVMEEAASRCKPTIVDAGGTGACNEIMHFLFYDYLPAHPAETVLIAARWDQGDISSVDQTLSWAKKNNLNVVLFGPIVEYDSPVPRILAMAVQNGDPGLPKAHQTDKTAVDAALEAVARRNHVPYVSLQKMMCPAGACTVYASPGVPMQFDYSHLTRAGSIWVATHVAEMDILQPSKPE